MVSCSEPINLVLNKGMFDTPFRKTEQIISEMKIGKNRITGLRSEGNQQEFMYLEGETTLIFTGIHVNQVKRKKKEESI